MQGLRKAQPKLAREVRACVGGRRRLPVIAQDVEHAAAARPAWWVAFSDVGPCAMQPEQHNLEVES